MPFGGLSSTGAASTVDVRGGAAQADLGPSVLRCVCRGVGRRHLLAIRVRLGCAHGRPVGASDPYDEVCDEDQGEALSRSEVPFGALGTKGSLASSDDGVPVADTDRCGRRVRFWTGPCVRVY